MHSATKAIAGHNDATLGVVAGSRELIDWLWGFAVLQGANAVAVRRDERPAGPAHARRPPRASRASRPSALAEVLEADPRVAEVRYPGLASHPQHDLAERQMALPGGLLTFDVVGGLDAGRALRRGAARSPSSPRRSAGPRRW